jgi:uracil-DNA glycosylase
MSNKIYFLFGSEATKYYFDNSDLPLEEVAETIKRMEHATSVYNYVLSHPSELLLDYDGWNGFAEIEEELYKLLNLKTKP